MGDIDKMRLAAMFIVVATTLAGCASAPPATFSYHPPKLNLQLNLAETISCLPDNTDLIYQATPSVTTSYVADPGVTWSVAMPRGFLTDSDFTVNFTDDGQLTTINSTLTGQAGPVLKDLISLSTAAAGAGVGAHAINPVCKSLLSKPVSLSYTAEITDFSALGASGDAIQQPFEVVPELSSVAARIRTAVPNRPTYTATILRLADTPRATFGGSGFAALTLRPVMNAELIIKNSQGRVLSDQEVPIPDAKAAPYAVALPNPVLFGGSTFNLTLSTSGAIKQIGYKSTGGEASVVEVATAATTAATPSTTADRAAQLKAKADIIAQQTRLAKCISQPSTCQ
jgi:hypothetical protein